MLKKTNYRLLFVENEAFIRKIAVAVLKPYFEVVDEACDGVEALEMYESHHPDLIITDIEMPNMDGLELCTQIRKKDKHIPIIITTAYTPTEYLLEAIGLNLVKYLLKPIEEARLFEALEICFEHLEEQFPSVIKITSTEQFDILNHTLLHENSVTHLTEYQYKLLEILVKNRGRIVSYQEIENYIWFDKSMSNDALRSLVRDVRKFVGKKTIVNISKYGYKINLHE